MLDDHASRRTRGIEFGEALIGSVGVINVVVGKFPALQLPRGGDAGATIGRAIEGGVLVRVLAIAQRLNQPPSEGAEIRGLGFKLIGEPVRYRGIVVDGAGIS